MFPYLWAISQASVGQHREERDSGQRDEVGEDRHPEHRATLDLHSVYPVLCSKRHHKAQWRLRHNTGEAAEQEGPDRRR
jgi:hypothetical protein